MNCEHPEIVLDYVPQVSGDTNVIMLTMRVCCAQCGPLRFIGIDMGLSLNRPSTSVDGCILHLPVIGELEEAEAGRLVS